MVGDPKDPDEELVDQVGSWAEDLLPLNNELLYKVMLHTDVNK